jgi:hypothetical protein
MEHFLTSNILPFSHEFSTKLNSCLLNNQDDENKWILQFILDQKSLLDIAKRFNIDYDFNYTSSTTSALFDAFIHFKEGKSFDVVAASYLSSRSGIIARSIQYDANKIFIDILYLTVNDLILELDGTQFFVWLNQLALQGDKILYPVGIY